MTTRERLEKFAVALEEAARATETTSTRFIEPAAGTLDRALSNRNHLVFGRRGSGKTSLLQQARKEMLADRRPNAYIDMEKFKGHAYPDVLISVLIETYENVRSWLAVGAVAPATKKAFWQRMVPNRGPLPRSEALRLTAELSAHVEELSKLLYAHDDTDVRVVRRAESLVEDSNRIEAGVKLSALTVGGSTSSVDRTGTSDETTETLKRSKIDFLHRRIIEYQKTLRAVVALASQGGFILLDDLYHIRRSNQADVLDYFHRLFKGTGLWLKVGTIRHRSSWYRNGDPPIGVKLGDDIEEIDLDLTLEKYMTAKRFLLQVASGVAAGCEISLSGILKERARDRLVLGSGGVARDFLSILRKSIGIALEQGAVAIGMEAVNQAAGEHETTKRDEFTRDVEDGREELEREFERLKKFCLDDQRKNCFLIEKDLRGSVYENVKELVDLRLVHSIASRITIPRRPGKIYEGYMIDISQYTGERKRRNLDMLEFWKRDGSDKLRGTTLIFASRDSTAA